VSHFSWHGGSRSSPALPCQSTCWGKTMTEAEWSTHKDRIDPRLDAAGWVIPPAGMLCARRIRERPLIPS